MITAIEIPADVQDPRLKAIVKAKDGKRYLIFDPTNERTPVGNLPSYEQGSYGTLAAGASSQIIALPVLPPTPTAPTARAPSPSLPTAPSPAPSMPSTPAPWAPDLRMFLKYSDEKERREYWENTSPRFPASPQLLPVHSAPALDKPLEFHYKVTAASTPTRPVRSCWSVRAWSAQTCPALRRQAAHLPIDLNATGRWRDSFDITLPPGYVVDETPDPVDVDSISPPTTPPSRPKATSSTTSANTSSARSNPRRQSRRLPQARRRHPHRRKGNRRPQKAVFHRQKGFQSSLPSLPSPHLPAPTLT
jgi:hypothetical protein